MVRTVASALVALAAAVVVANKERLLMTAQVTVVLAVALAAVVVVAVPAGPAAVTSSVSTSPIMAHPPFVIRSSTVIAQAQAVPAVSVVLDKAVVRAVPAARRVRAKSAEAVTVDMVVPAAKAVAAQVAQVVRPTASSLHSPLPAIMSTTEQSPSTSASKAMAVLVVITDLQVSA